MPKIKTKRAAAKRFKKTANGNLKRNKAYKSHILTKKTTKRKRNLRKATMTDATNTLRPVKRRPMLGGSQWANLDILLLLNTTRKREYIPAMQSNRNPIQQR